MSPTKTTVFVPTEAQECKLLVAYLRLRKVPFTHIPNSVAVSSARGGHITRMNNAQMGVSPGFPDYLCFPNNQIVVIEMKRRSGGVLSAHQKDWLEILEQSGIPNYVCKGFEQAKQVIDEYLGGQNA